MWKLISWLHRRQKSVHIQFKEAKAEAMRFGTVAMQSQNVHSDSFTRVSVANKELDAEKVKKEFESTLDERNRDSLPVIQILKVFEPTVAPTTSSPTLLPSTASLPSPSSSLLSSSPSLSSSPTLSPSLSPLSPSLSPSLSSSPPLSPSLSSSPSSPPLSPSPSSSLSTLPPSPPTSSSSPPSFPLVSKPSHWKSNDVRFKGVKVRLYVGTQKQRFSLFSNRIIRVFLLS